MVQGRTARLLRAPRHLQDAARLVYRANPRLSVVLVGLSLLSGVLPALIALVGKWIVDLVVASLTATVTYRDLLPLVGLEFALVVLLTGAHRALSTSDSLLRVELAQTTSETILGKAARLSLTDFEDAETYDRLRYAREHSSEKPINLVRGALRTLQATLSLVGYLLLIAKYAWWMLPLILLAAIPAVIAEARFSADSFRLYRWHSPEARRQAYFETILARDDHAKEIKLFDLSDTLIAKHREIFETLFAQDRKLAFKRATHGFVLSVFSAAALAVGYAWVALAALDRTLSVGEMTMLLVVLKQAHAVTTSLIVSTAHLYEDHLYLRTLEEFLALPVTPPGTSKEGPKPGDGLRFVDVHFSYPGSKTEAIRGITLHIPPSSRLGIVGPNGSGKTTFVKLLLGLYRPTKGQVLLDGLDLRQWCPERLYSRFAVLFQDFVRYQFTAGENIGVGDISAFHDVNRWQHAARVSAIDRDVSRLPRGYDTQLGHWFPGGRELSIGQWQRLALARVFMRTKADILVLDEPTSHIDAEAEATILDRFIDSGEAALIIVSHRPSTLVKAEQVLVFDDGLICEHGSPKQLGEKGSKYLGLHEASENKAPENA